MRDDGEHRLIFIELIDHRFRRLAQRTVAQFGSNPDDHTLLAKLGADSSGSRPKAQFACGELVQDQRLAVRPVPAGLKQSTV